MIPNINPSFLFTVARWCWRHKFMTVFLVGVFIVWLSPNDRAFSWSVGVVMVAISIFPTIKSFSDGTLFSGLFSRRSKDEHQRGSKIVSSRELSRAVEKSEK